MSTGSVCDVVLLVLDTLREDYSGRLDELVDLGFVRYENTIAPSPWTGPSHASMFTGLMPSVHHIHESRNHLDSITQSMGDQFRVEQSNIITELGNRGYDTFALTCNPMISRRSGYSFNHYHLYDSRGDVSKLGPDHHSLKKVQRNRLKKLMGTHPLEKGSKYCTTEVSRLKSSRPFFLFVNLMECHEPYNWNDDLGITAYSQLSQVLGKRSQFQCNWRGRYGVHSRLALSRGVSIAREILRQFENSLIIVTSDHGQLLGEDGRYGHGYFLDDELLRVPLYIRYPRSVTPCKQTKKFVSLVSVAAIVRGVIDGTSPEVGTDLAMGESFGPTKNIVKLAQSQDERMETDKAFAHRVKIYCPKGTAAYNKTNDTLEKSTGGVTLEEARGYAEVLPQWKESNQFERTSETEVFDAKEEEAILERLHGLGYG